MCRCADVDISTHPHHHPPHQHRPSSAPPATVIVSPHTTPRAVQVAADILLRQAISDTAGQLVDALEGLYGRLSKVLLDHQHEHDRMVVLRAAEEALAVWRGAHGGA